MARTIRPMSYGGPEVLDVVEVSAPIPAPDQVVVQVRAAGVNPIDWKLYSGASHAVDDKHKDGVGVDSLPRIGLECAGVVTAVGAEVSGVEIDDEVIVYPVTGAYADYVVAGAESLLPKPSSLDWPQAGALMLAGTTAVHTLYAAGVRAGDRVLIHGGSRGCWADGTPARRRSRRHGHRHPGPRPTTDCCAAWVPFPSSTDPACSTESGRRLPAASTPHST